MFSSVLNPCFPMTLTGYSASLKFKFRWKPLIVRCRPAPDSRLRYLLFFTFFIFSFAFYKYSCYIQLKLIVLRIFLRGESNEFHYFTVRRMHPFTVRCSSSIDSIRPEKFPAPSSKFFGFSKQVSFLVWTPDFFCWSDPSERSDLSDKFKEFKIIRKENHLCLTSTIGQSLRSITTIRR